MSWTPSFPSSQAPPCSAWAHTSSASWPTCAIHCAGLTNIAKKTPCEWAQRSFWTPGVHESTNGGTHATPSNPARSRKTQSPLRLLRLLGAPGSVSRSEDQIDRRSLHDRRVCVQRLRHPGLRRETQTGTGLRSIGSACRPARCAGLDRTRAASLGGPGPERSGFWLKRRKLMTTSTRVALPPKQETGFPEVGILRKGGPKKKGKSKDGREIDVVGDDLNDRFRSVFHPGTADVQTRFFEVYQTYQPAVVRAMMPFHSVWRNWTCFYEAHVGGCMIAKADAGQKRIISLRHPVSKEYIIRDGEPYTPFTPGERFEFNGKEIKFKPTGRLRLFLPDLRRFVTFLLKTTSFYDKLNVERNLAAIQAIADAIQEGNAAGIPFLAYRRETEITWKQSRITKWLVYLEIDPDSTWAQQAMDRLLAGGLAEQLVAPATLAIDDGEPLETMADDEEDDPFEDEAGMVEPEHPAAQDLPPIVIPAAPFALAASPIEPVRCEACGEKFPLHKPDCPTKKRAQAYYLDKAAVDMDNPAEVNAYDDWVKANPGQRPASRQALRDWLSTSKQGER